MERRRPWGEGMLEAFAHVGWGAILISTEDRVVASHGDEQARQRDARRDGQRGVLQHHGREVAQSNAANVNRTMKTIREFSSFGACVTLGPLARETATRIVYRSRDGKMAWVANRLAWYTASPARRAAITSARNIPMAIGVEGAMFVRQPVDGVIYLARRSRRSTNFLWSAIVVASQEGDARMAAAKVPCRGSPPGLQLFESDRLWMKMEG
jgi:hypothetical protein